MPGLSYIKRMIRGVGKDKPVTETMLSDIINFLLPPKIQARVEYQENHGFVFGEPIYRADGSSWTKAIGNSLSKAADAIVSEVLDEDRFKIIQTGPLVAGGTWTDGKKYYLSPDTEGLIIEGPESWIPGQIIQYLGKGIADGLLVEIRDPEVYQIQPWSGSIDAIERGVLQIVFDPPMPNKNFEVFAEARDGKRVVETHINQTTKTVNGISVYVRDACKIIYEVVPHRIIIS